MRTAKWTEVGMGVGFERGVSQLGLVHAGWDKTLFALVLLEALPYKAFLRNDGDQCAVAVVKPTKDDTAAVGGRLSLHLLPARSVVELKGIRDKGGTYDVKDPVMHVKVLVEPHGMV